MCKHIIEDLHIAVGRKIYEFLNTEYPLFCVSSYYGGIGLIQCLFSICHIRVDSCQVYLLIHVKGICSLLNFLIDSWSNDEKYSLSIIGVVDLVMLITCKVEDFFWYKLRTYISGFCCSRFGILAKNLPLTC